MSKSKRHNQLYGLVAGLIISTGAFAGGCGSSGNDQSDGRPDSSEVSQVAPQTGSSHLYRVVTHCSKHCHADKAIKKGEDSSAVSPPDAAAPADKKVDSAPKPDADSGAVVPAPAPKVDPPPAPKADPAPAA